MSPMANARIPREAHLRPSDDTGNTADAGALL